jgi:hypothetical protein
VPLPTPYSRATDGALIEGCVAGDRDAFTVLWQRHGRLSLTTIARTLDGHGRGEAREAPVIYERLQKEVLKNGAGCLRKLGPDASLRHCLTVLAYEAASSHVEDATPIASVMSPAPTPAEILLDDLVGLEPAHHVTQALRKLSPQIMAILRFELRGLTSREIAAALGTTEEMLARHLDRTAQKIAEISAEPDDRGLASQLWRSLLGCASVEERVRLATLSEDDPEVAARRESARRTWAAVRERALTVPQPHSVHCLDEVSLASFVAGMRGADRARAEGHVTTCGRCADAVAGLVLHLRAVPTLRAAEPHAESLAVAAACAATDHPRPALAYAERAEREERPRADEIHRVSMARRRLATSLGELPRQESSRVVARDDLPTDDEAPLLALEALVTGDASAAAQALDDHVAKRLVGARLRLLAMASGHDLEDARRLSERALEGTDPDLRADAELVLALPEERALPRELLVERLVDLLPSLIRLILSRP